MPEPTSLSEYAIEVLGGKKNLTKLGVDVDILTEWLDSISITDPGFEVIRDVFHRVEKSPPATSERLQREAIESLKLIGERGGAGVDAVRQFIEKTIQIGPLNRKGEVNAIHLLEDAQRNHGLIK